MIKFLVFLVSFDGLLTELPAEFIKFTINGTVVFHATVLGDEMEGRCGDGRSRVTGSEGQEVPTQTDFDVGFLSETESGFEVSEDGKNVLVLVEESLSEQIQEDDFLIQRQLGEFGGSDLVSFQKDVFD